MGTTSLSVLRLVTLSVGAVKGLRAPVLSTLSLQQAARNISELEDAAALQVSFFVA